MDATSPTARPVIPDGLDADRGKTLRAPVILDLLEAEHPDAHIALDFSNRWELLVATVLSAQSTDVKVNEVTPALFADLPGPAAFAEAGVERIQGYIASLGLFRQKAKNLHATAVLLLERHGGEVPGTMEELLELPGVARKTANVVLSNGFGINVGGRRHARPSPVAAPAVHPARRREEDRARPHAPVPAGTMAGRVRPADLPRAAGVRCPTAPLRGLRHRTAVPVLPGGGAHRQALITARGPWPHRIPAGRRPP
jgi:hypothetical protein